MLNKQIGQRIRELREIQHYTRFFLSQKADITEKFLGEIENGQKGISAKTLIKIASALSVSADYILFGSEKGRESSEKIITTLECMDELQKKKIHEFIVIVDELLR